MFLNNLRMSVLILKKRGWERVAADLHSAARVFIGLCIHFRSSATILFLYRILKIASCSVHVPFVVFASKKRGGKGSGGCWVHEETEEVHAVL